MPPRKGTPGYAYGNPSYGSPSYYIPYANTTSGYGYPGAYTNPGYD
jgi:hypothetical protein